MLATQRFAQPFRNKDHNGHASQANSPSEPGCLQPFLAERAASLVPDSFSCAPCPQEIATRRRECRKACLRVAVSLLPSSVISCLIYDLFFDGSVSVEILLRSLLKCGESNGAGVAITLVGCVAAC